MKKSARILFFIGILTVSAVVISAVVEESVAISPATALPDGDGQLIAGRNVNMVAGTGCVDGDPYLQRQNEPSLAVSTRNSLTLLAGANDYRTVDMPFSEGPLPGIPEGAAAGDAWLGVFKSFNGGESWISTLLPGHPKDMTPVGQGSPLFGLDAASDPTVRAGANGMFFYSGIAFDRIVRGRSVIFVARFIDNNYTKLGDTDPVKYLDTQIIDTGTSGQFADKPWLAVAAPRPGSGTVPIMATDTPLQEVACYDVYMAYSVFLGSGGSAGQSWIMFSRSTDSGTTWQRPIKVSESNVVNQGTTIAISPKDGTIYLAWRRFATPNAASAIMICQSNDFGATFTKAVEVDPDINAFDQFSAPNRFRTYAYPTVAVDKDGLVYVAWPERGMGPTGDARIVLSTSANGVDWTAAQPVDNHGGYGHQIMPSLTFAAGKLRMTWYDTRRSEGGPGYDISDPGAFGNRHTMDVWVAQASPSPTPDFSNSSTKVTKFLHWWEEAAEGGSIVQKEAFHPNDPLFEGGTKPFIGDYIDIAPSPTFIFDVDLETQTGYWRFNTEETDPATSFVTWTDNRDVNPGDGIWTNYTPPASPCSSSVPVPCDPSYPTTTGKRNQNIYVSHISEGLLIGAPVNAKPLWVPTPPTNPERPQRRTFLIFAKNLTEFPKLVRMTIEKPADMDASFWEEYPVPEEEWVCPFVSCGKEQLDVEIAPYSSISLTVFVVPYETNPYATFRVKVEDLGGIFTDYIVLNPDPENTRIVPAVEEYHTPDYVIETPFLVNFEDPTVLSEEIVYVPDLEYILENVNPDVLTPTFRSPTFRSGNVVNPTFRSASVEDLSGGTVTDLQWRIANNNDAASAYSFIPIGYPPDLPEGGAYQLLIYRVSTTPSAGAVDATHPNYCQLYEEEHHELIMKVESPTFRSPTFRSPTFRSPTFRSPTFRSNTFSLAPGEEAVCTLRFIEPPESVNGAEETAPSGPSLRTGGQMTDGFDPAEYAKTVAGAAVAQAANPDGRIHFSSSLYIIEKPLPPALADDIYSVQLEAFGGEPVTRDPGEDPNDPGDDICTYEGKWTPAPLLYSSGAPSGLYMDANGLITGTPVYDPNLVYPQVVSFMAEVTDLSTPPQVARRDFTITVSVVFHPVTVTAGPHGEIHYLDGSEEKSVSGGSAIVLVPHGQNQDFTIVPWQCYDVAVVTVTLDGTAIFSGKVAQYTLADVRSDGFEIEASFLQIAYKITATTETDPPTPPGGTIDPSGEISVGCGGSITLTISPSDGYLITDVTDNGVSQGPQSNYTIEPVLSDHVVIAKFRPLDSWVRRYNNDEVNGDDQGRAMAVYPPSGNVFVTGTSTGRTTGPDAYTISYNSEGLQGWSARFDGPAHLGDHAVATAADAAGNVYVAGLSFRGMVTKHADYVTLKYNVLGHLEWDSEYDDRRNGNDEITAMALDAQGFVYVTGRSEDSLNNKAPKHYDYYTIKYNPDNGKAVWAARYDGSLIANSADEATGIAVDAAGNVFVTGRSQRGSDDYDFVTIKYNSMGIEQWSRRYDGGHGNDEARGIAVDAAGNAYVTGRSRGSETGFDYLTIKYDPSGTELWVKRHDGGHGDDEAVAIALDAAGHVYVTGRSQGNNTDFDYLTAKYDTETGSPLWIQKHDHREGADEAAAIALDTIGNVYVTGRSEGEGSGFDYLTMKYDGSGNTIWRARYNHENCNGDDEAAAIALDAAGNVFVTGRSQGLSTGIDYATVKYIQNPGKN